MGLLWAKLWKLFGREGMSVVCVCVYVCVSIIITYARSLPSSQSHTHIEYKIIIVGLDNAGKTTILYQL